MTATRTGAKLHRLAAEVGDLPATGMVALARAGKKVIADTAAGAGVASMRLAGRARGARQTGPARPRRTVRLKARDKLAPGAPVARLRLQAVPVGPWVWVNTGTDPHLVGQTKRGRKPQWVRGARYDHGVRGPVVHPGTSGRQVWRRAAERVTAIAPVVFTEELHDLVKAF